MSSAFTDEGFYSVNTYMYFMLHFSDSQVFILGDLCSPHSTQEDEKYNVPQWTVVYHFCALNIHVHIIRITSWILNS